MTAPLSLKRLARAWNEFFFAPRDTRMCDVIRIAYSFLLLVNALVLLPDLELWFSEMGLMPFDVSRTIIDPDTLTVFQWLPKTDATLWTCYVVFVVQIALLMVGFRPRLQAVCVFVWFTSFNHRFLFLWDGEDTVFRLLGFFVIFCPIGRYYSVDRWLKNRRRGKSEPDSADDGPIVAWGLRMIQLQMTLIYVSTAWEKLNGAEWINGTALYYVSRLDDTWGRFPIFEGLFESLWVIRAMTWAILLVECLLPLGLWFKETRRIALIMGFALHLAIDYLMVLFLFQWIMMVGLLSFVEVGDLRDLAAFLGRIKKRVTRRAGPET